MGRYRYHEHQGLHAETGIDERQTYAIIYHRIQWIWKFPRTFTSPIKIHKHGVTILKAGKLTKGCALAQEEVDGDAFSSQLQLEDMAKRKVGIEGFQVRLGQQCREDWFQGEADFDIGFDWSDI